MPSEITAFLQAQTQAQTLRNTSTQSVGEETAGTGKFEALMSEYVSQGQEEIETIMSEYVLQGQKEIEMVMGKYVSQVQEETEMLQPAITVSSEETPQLVTFRGNHSFPQSVINVLAGLNEAEDLTLTQKIDGITNALEDIGTKISSVISKIKAVVSEKISAVTTDELPNNIDDIEQLITRILSETDIPEDTKNEIIKASGELLNVLHESGSADEVIKAFAGLIREHPKGAEIFAAVGDDEEANFDLDDTDKTEETEKIGGNKSSIDISVENVQNAPGAGVVQNVDLKPVQTAGESESLPEPSIASQSHNVPAQNVPHEFRRTTHKSESNPDSEPEPENLNHETNFDEQLERFENEHEMPEQNQNQNQSNTPSGHEDEQSIHQPTSRQRTESRRASNDSVTRNDHTETSATRPRTESRNNFQAFFEGVLSSRRNTSQPQPLDLRTAAYIPTQGSTLRNGIVNVVRFIRADGVHKANVIVDPPALGRISVELSTSSSGVEASIKVASEQIRQLVQDQLSELRMNLSQQGVQVAEFTVDVQQDNSNNGNHQGSSDDGTNGRRILLPVNGTDDDTEEFRIDLEEGLLHWIA